MLPDILLPFIVVEAIFDVDVAVVVLADGDVVVCPCSILSIENKIIIIQLNVDEKR